MYQTVRKIIISLLILAQAIVLWQGAFAAGLIPDTVDTDQTNCHQTTISEHTSLTTTQINDEMPIDSNAGTLKPEKILEHDERQNCQENCCGDFCQCGSCVCAGFALIPSYVSMSFSIGILNHISFPIFLDWQPVLLFKPPRQFRR
jgi:hypothetical protein